MQKWTTEAHRTALESNYDEFNAQYPGLTSRMGFQRRVQRLRKGDIPIEVEADGPIYEGDWFQRNSVGRQVMKITNRELENIPTNGVLVRNAEVDKKEGNLNWRDVNATIRDMQRVKHEASTAQDDATFHFDSDVVKVIALSDTHLGSWSADYELFERITDEILNTPNLYVILAGDLVNMAIRMRGVMEVSDDLLTPKLQMDYLISWLDEMKGRVLFAGWDNHAVIRQEELAGYSQVAHILSERTVYYNGIGHANVIVGDELYPVAMSHFFRGKSAANPCYGPQRYILTEGIDREIAIAGDSHVPGMMTFMLGGKRRVAINTGTTHTNSGYAKRFFSLQSHPIFPCFVLSGERHEITPFWTVGEMMRFA